MLEMREVIRDYRLKMITSTLNDIKESDIFSKTNIQAYIYMMRVFDNDECKLIIKKRDGMKNACKLKLSRLSDGTAFLGEDELHFMDDGLKIISAGSCYNMILEYLPPDGKEVKA